MVAASGLGIVIVNNGTVINNNKNKIIKLWNYIFKLEKKAFDFFLYLFFSVLF